MYKIKDRKNNSSEDENVSASEQIQDLNGLFSLRETSKQEAEAVEKKINLAHSYSQEYMKETSKHEEINLPHQHDAILKNEAEDAAVISFVEKKQRKAHSGVQTSYKVLRGETPDEFISSVLQCAKVNHEGNFSQRHQNKTTTVYYCERHSKPKSKANTRDPSQTRANACKAYISFVFEMVQSKGLYVGITRKQLLHNGHNLADSNELRVSQIDESLVNYIKCLIAQGKKPMEIIVLCWGWAKSRGQRDFKNRQYYPTPQDIKYLSATVKAEKRVHKDDALSVDYLCREVIQDSIVMYQPMDDDHPLIIVYQNAKQLERMKEYGKNLVFMDASYKGLTGYNFAVYCIQARNSLGHGTPLAFIITSSETKEVLSSCLTALKEKALKHGTIFEPRAFMVDKDAREISSIQATFPKSVVLLCWFHVLQAIYRWLNLRESGVSGTENAPVRKHIVSLLRKLKYTTTKEEFQEQAKLLSTSLQKYPHVLKYLTQHWLDIGHMWANFGRRFHHEDHETNNLVERFFLTLKYHFLGGYINRRVDELLLLLDGDVAQFHDYIEELQKAGRLEGETVLCKGKEQAQTMLLQGWAQRCVWAGDKDCVCQVPSQSQQNHMWSVDLLRGTCNCPASSQRGMCKHMHIGLNVAAMRNVDVNLVRASVAKAIFDNKQFIVNGNEISIFDKDNISYVSTLQNCSQCTCTCIAASHGIQCICCQVAALITASTPAESNLVSDEISESCEAFTTDDKCTTNRCTESANKQKCKEKLMEITAWLDSEKFKCYEHKEEVYSQVSKLHASVFTSKFQKLTRKRKIEPNSSYRKLVEKAKKLKMGKDHSYSNDSNDKKISKNKSTKKIDGGFRKTSRKNGRKKPFF